MNLKKKNNKIMNVIKKYCVENSSAFLKGSIPHLRFEPHFLPFLFVGGYIMKDKENKDYMNENDLIHSEITGQNYDAHDVVRLINIR